MNSSNQRFKYARKFMHMQEIHSFFAYELKIYNSWNKAVVSKYFLVVFDLSFISSFRVEQNYLVINYSLVFPLVFRFCTYKKIYTYIFRDFFNVILYSWGLKQLMIYQMNTFGFSSKGPFYILLLCFFFFFFCFIICFSGVWKNRWISSDCEHWKSLIKKIAPKFVWTWSHAYSAWMIWTPVTSHFQKDKLMSRAVHFSMIWEKAPVDLLFKKIDIGDFNNLRPVSTLLHISKLKERAVFAQPNFHPSSSGLHPMHQSAKT